MRAGTGTAYFDNIHLQPSFTTGAAGEQYLRQATRSVKPGVRKAGDHGDRFWDGYNAKTNTAYESKVGYMTYSGNVKKQVLKDGWLIKNNPGLKIEWHFYRSGNTGKAGPSAPLRRELNNNGIKVVDDY